MNNYPSALISGQQLVLMIEDDPSVVVLDATYGQPVDFSIPNAIPFDIDTVSDHNAPFAHTIPCPQEFERHAQNMGINNDSVIVVYDRGGFWMAAARVWWMFRLFGHKRIYVLDGGLNAWAGDVVPTSSHQPAADKGDFKSSFQSHLYKSYDDIETIVKTGSDIILDARPAASYDAGHIPHSTSLPLPNIIHNDGTLKSRDALGILLKDYLDTKTPLAASCGSGVTACALALALYECGRDDVAIYDGSWTQWRSQQESNLQPTA